MLTDLAAWLVGEGVDASRSMPEAARMLDAWAEAGVVHMPGRLSPTVFAICEGRVVDTRKAHAVAGIGGRIVTDERLRREAKLVEQFTHLARSQGKPLVVAMPASATPEQISAIRVVAQGRRLATLRGPAGVGKSSVLKPVAAGARRAGMEVVVTARNARTAREAGDSVGADVSLSLAAYLSRAAGNGTRAASAKPTLVIVEEGGVTDEVDLLALTRLAQDPKNRIQMIGVIRRQTEKIHKREILALERQQARENRRHDLHAVLEEVRGELLVAEQRLDGLSRRLDREKKRLHALPPNSTAAARQRQIQSVARLGVLHEQQRNLHGRIAERWDGAEKNVAAQLAELDQLDAADRRRGQTSLTNLKRRAGRPRRSSAIISSARTGRSRLALDEVVRTCSRWLHSGEQEFDLHGD